MTVAPSPARSSRSASSLSSTAAATVRWAVPSPVPVTWKEAVSPTSFVSPPAASVTTRQMSHVPGVMTWEPPDTTARFVAPETRATSTVTLADGALRRRTKNRPSPSSRTHTLVRLRSRIELNDSTSKDRDTGSAGSQLVLPDWPALTVTRPSPVKLRFVPLTTAGPVSTSYSTGRPLDAVAASPTVFVTH